MYVKVYGTHIAEGNCVIVINQDMGSDEML